MNIPEFNEIIEPNDQTEARRDHLNKIKEIVGNAYPNKFDRTRISGDEDTITNLVNFAPVKEVAEEMAAHVKTLAERERPNAELKEKLNAKLKDLGNVRISGRLAVPPRVMGKAAFVHLSDGVERLQIYCRKGEFLLEEEKRRKGEEEKETTENSSSPHLLISSSPESAWELFGFLDHGDFVGVEGFLFLTNTGELSVHVETIKFLAKAMLPMPDKIHGIADPELQRRYRYADLIASSLQIEHEGLTTREVFERRAKLISGMRNYLEAHGYIEVETPMLTAKATGAAAEPFETFHKALGIPLFARIAPELYLKRLVVGGFEKVFELNRNFRNEGLSMKHNPEFTMLEFYCAYMDAEGMMDFAEAMIKESVRRANGGSLQVKYGENEIDFSNFERLTMLDAIKRQAKDNDDPYLQILLSTVSNDAKIMLEVFEREVEGNLINPTFIIDYPKSISPLSKASPENPQIAERFELFINGMECANGFSELNDPQEQYERFVDQMKERESGDAEAMVLDEDYIRALAYGMPPAAGIGIGIDRLVMLLTNKHSIRDVILFPHMRPIVKEEEEKRRRGEEEKEINPS